MAWIVSLFGHYKPKDLGWERRNVPGDIISFRPWRQNYDVPLMNRYLFAMVVFDGFTVDQMIALKEWEWDLDSYKEYDTLTTTPEVEYELCRLPQRHWRKRRFNIPIETMQRYLIDTDKMLDTSSEYLTEMPTIDISDVYDKLKERNVDMTRDNLSVIEPRTLEEVLNPPTTESILTAMRS